VHAADPADFLQRIRGLPTLALNVRLKSDGTAAVGACRARIIGRCGSCARYARGVVGRGQQGEWRGARVVRCVSPGGRSPAPRRNGRLRCRCGCTLCQAWAMSSVESLSRVTVRLVSSW